jgi:hypothetical protein
MSRAATIAVSRRRPPLWLAAAAVASGWAALYSIGRWILLYAFAPVHEDVRMTYVAAEAGVRYGWSTIYDQAILRSLSTGFPAGQRHIDSLYTYLHPPLVAWLFAPLTAFPEPVAYALWTLLSLAALVVAWHLAAPYTGLAKVTLLLLALGLWPVLFAFYFGQPTMFLIALVAATWWLCAHDRPLVAGAALALATFLKPQDIALVPVALLVSGRGRVVISWASACAVLGLASAVALGPQGLVSWWQALTLGQDNPAHTLYTLANLLGLGPLTYALWGVQGAAAMFVARWRRDELEIVFTAGLLGSAAVAFHFHELDYSILVLAAWLTVRTAPPLWHRLWLLLGVIPMQLMTYGTDSVQPIWNLAWHGPQLIWDAGWLGILVVSCFAKREPRVGAEARPVQPHVTATDHGTR